MRSDARALPDAVWELVDEGIDTVSMRSDARALPDYRDDLKEQGEQYGFYAL